MPFDVKDQKAEYHIDGVPFDNHDGEIHHRSEKLTGISDFKLYAIRQWNDILVKDDLISFSFGTSLPLGKTEEDPIRRADNHAKHLHIQFGSGTFDPIFRFSYIHPTHDNLKLFFNFNSQLPFYESRKAYRAPRTNELTIGPMIKINDNLSAGLFYAITRQGYAHWHGERDVNSGYTQQSAVLSLPWKISDKYSLNPTFIRSLDVDTFTTGDGFEMDWLYSLALNINF